MDIKYQNKTPGIVKAIQVCGWRAGTAAPGLRGGQEAAWPWSRVRAGTVCTPALTAARPAAPAGRRGRHGVSGAGVCSGGGERRSGGSGAKPAEAAAPEPEPAAAKQAAPAPPPKPAAAPAKPAAAAPAKPAAAAPAPGPPTPGQRPERRVPMTRLRRRVAERLKGAQNTYAMLSTFNEVDMTQVMEMRRELKVGGWCGLSTAGTLRGTPAGHSCTRRACPHASGLAHACPRPAPALPQDAFLERHGVKLGFMSAFVKVRCAALGGRAGHGAVQPPPLSANACWSLLAPSAPGPMQAAGAALQYVPAVNGVIDGNDIIYR